VRECEDGAEPFLVHVRGAHVVMCGHLEATHISERSQRVLARDREQRILRGRARDRRGS
jgi:hypothetical protein